MNLYPANIEEKIGFDQIRRLLGSFCQSNQGAALVQKMKPVSNYEVIRKCLRQVGEMSSLKSSTKNKVSFEFIDFEVYLTNIKIPGSFLNPQDFHELKKGINAVSLWSVFLQQHSTDYPSLCSLAEQIELNQDLASQIDRVTDKRGEVKDAASPKLSEIRLKIVKSERAVRSAIQEILRKAKTDELTEDESTLTVRNGRLVIPIKAEHKKRVPGFIHDESATGRTVFLEPGEVLDLNNQVQQLKYQERREVISILTVLADSIRANMHALIRGADLIEKLDFIYAKVKLQELLKASLPNIIKTPALDIINARHPLLYLSHKESEQSVVPLNLKLNDQNRILIISGPNAGGKSVALKTVGLLQFMIQCGLPVPVDEESKLGVFTSLFIDIGDAQSIENDLSTYSSHLTSMKYFLSESNKNTLFLIDEFGKGTEPQFGGAIAEVVLQHLNHKKASGIVTTHYHNLKKTGDETAGLINGAMKHDQEALEPLFELEIGKPGSSLAFEIAGKIGLPQDIINRAKKTVGKSHVNYDKLLSELGKEKRKYDKLLKQLDDEKTNLYKISKDYEDLRKMLEADRSRILKEAKKEARQILEQANQDVERVIREIKESKAAKKPTIAARRLLEEKKECLMDKERVTPQKLKTGDKVTIAEQDTVGIIKKVNGKQVEVFFGGLKSIVSIDRLVKAKTSSQVVCRKKIRRLGIDVSQKMANFSHELSIRGMRMEEATSKIESYLDEALLVGVDKVRIVHGKGHGVLREIVRNISKDHPGVSSVEDEHADRGGAGISIVKLQ
ncbi:MAG: endonuclease MutS2 [Ekhidna sp.]|nr:endonuclease MutS2 [Ekhidna sp.]